MLEGEILVGERFGAVDCGAAGAVAVEEVSALDHEAFDLSCFRLRLPRYDSAVLTTRWNLLPL